MLIIQENSLSNLSLNLSKAVYIALLTNSFGKDMKPSLLLSTMSK